MCQKKWQELEIQTWLEIGPLPLWRSRADEEDECVTQGGEQRKRWERPQEGPR